MASKSRITKGPKGSKVTSAAKLLEHRVVTGGYQLRGIPGERKLATDLGISYLTARKAVQTLITNKILIRAENGRLTVAEAARTKKGNRPLQVAMIAPGFASQTNFLWENDAARVVEARGGTLRVFHYAHSSDPVIFQAIDADFDGLFVNLPHNPPRLLLERLVKDRHRVVVLWEDVSSLGIPNVDTAPARSISKLTSHLAQLGHERIDCFNTQPYNSVIADRINHWRLSIEQRHLQGELHNHPVEPFQSSAVSAYEIFGKMIEAGLDATAYFCPTSDLARGVIRACHERGVRIGQDISLCGFGEDDVAKLCVPSLTIVGSVAPHQLLDMGLDWIVTHGKGWNRPMRLEPDDVPMFIGESTGPAQKTLAIQL